MKTLLTLIAICWAGLASAALETWPALYDVSGVANDDTLNVRAEPNAQSEIIGTLAYDARDIEIVDVDENEAWGIVNIGEQSGWVSLRFLERQGERWYGSAPPIQSCFGMEPNWSLSLSGQQVTFRELGGSTLSEPVEFVYPTTPYQGFSLVGSQITALYDEERCHDGMSDRTFGVGIDIILRLEGGAVHHTGCCSILP